jgi:hypothetical protein
MMVIKGIVAKQDALCLQSGLLQAVPEVGRLARRDHIYVIASASVGPRLGHAAINVNTTDVRKTIRATTYAMIFTRSSRRT